MPRGTTTTTARITIGVMAVILGAAGLLMLASQVAAQTDTPTGPTVYAYEQVNVRAAPSTDSELVGVLVVGQRAKIAGRSPGGAWIQVEYLGGPDNRGWVYGDLVRLESVPDREQLPTVEPPPTATFALPEAMLPEALTVAPGAERLPTFTPAPPPSVPTLLPAEGFADGPRGLPPIFIIAGLLVTGVFGLIISLIRQSR